MNIKFSDEKKIFNLHTEGIPYLSFDMLDRLGVPNLFTTRYISYDEAAGSGITGLRTAVMKTESIEEASPVCRANRDKLARQLGSSIEYEIITDQKHTNYVHVASREDMGVPTVGSFALHRSYVDGIVTDIPGALLTVFGGDCPPVYIVDPGRQAVGLVHAGWRGTLGRIPAVAVAQMVVKFSCDPVDMYAAIGPGICKDCYEMGDEVYDEFAAEWGREDADRILKRYEPGTESEAFKALKLRCERSAEGSGKSSDSEEHGNCRVRYHLDLREANRLTLLRAGIPENHIAVSNVCTMCNADTFYSYRAGRMENEQVAMLVNRFQFDDICKLRYNLHISSKATQNEKI